MGSYAISKVSEFLKIKINKVSELSGVVGHPAGIEALLCGVENQNF